MVAAFAELRQRRRQATHRVFLLALSLVVPTVIILADREGRVYFGQLPSFTIIRTKEEDQTPPERLQSRLFPQAVSLKTRLQAFANPDGGVTIMRIETGPTVTIPASTPNRIIHALAFTPDGKVLAVADNDRLSKDSAITIWDIAPGEFEKQPSFQRIQVLGNHSEHMTFSLSFFPDNRTLLSASGDSSICLWDTLSGTELARFIAHRHPNSHWALPAYSITVAPDGKTFATWGYDGIKVWDTQSLRLMRILAPSNNGNHSLVFSSDGRYLIAADGNTVRYWKSAVYPGPLIGFSFVSVVLIGWLFSGGWTTPIRHSQGGNSQCEWNAGDSVCTGIPNSGNIS
jgi:WD40 repeat protein